MFALGKTKPSLEKALSVDKNRLKMEQLCFEAKKNPEKIWDLKQNKPELLDTLKQVEDFEKQKKSVQNAQN